MKYLILLLLISSVSAQIKQDKVTNNLGQLIIERVNAEKLRKHLIPTLLKDEKARKWKCRDGLLISPFKLEKLKFPNAAFFDFKLTPISVIHESGENILKEKDEDFVLRLSKEVPVETIKEVTYLLDINLPDLVHIFRFKKNEVDKQKKRYGLNCKFSKYRKEIDKHGRIKINTDFSLTDIEGLKTIPMHEKMDKSYQFYGSKGGHESSFIYGFLVGRESNPDINICIAACSKFKNYKLKVTFPVAVYAKKQIKQQKLNDEIKERLWKQLNNFNEEEFKKFVKETDLLSRKFDSDGYHIIHYALFREDLKVVKLLLEMGVPVDQTVAKTGYTNLHIACRKNLDLVKLLVSKGADVSALRVRINEVGKKEYFGQTPIFEAAGWASTEIIEYLLSKGADINEKYFSFSEYEFSTVLDGAIQNKENKFVEFLKKNGAKTSEEVKKAEKK